jgi:hypothetical protein
MKTKKMVMNAMVSTKKSNKSTTSLMSTNERKRLTRRREKNLLFEKMENLMLM